MILYSLLKLLVLGIGTPIIVLFVQVFFASEKENSLSSLVAITAIEEIIRFCILLFAEKKDLIPRWRIYHGLFFGFGFAFTEMFLSGNIPLMHIFLLFFVHSALSVFILLGIRSRTWIAFFFTAIAALLFHIGYNIGVDRIFS